MSSRQLEEQQERERDEWVAKALGMTPEELNELDWNVDEIDGNDGAVYSFRVEFSRDTDPVVIERVGGYSVNIGFPPEEFEPEQPE